MTLVELLKKQDCKTLLDAYDLMESVADKIEELEAELEKADKELNDFAECIAKYKYLEEQLQAIKDQKPVAWLVVESIDINGLWEIHDSVNQNGDGIPLYTNEVLK